MRCLRLGGGPLRDSRDGTVSWVRLLRPDPMKPGLRRETQVARWLLRDLEHDQLWATMHNGEGDLGHV